MAVPECVNGPCDDEKSSSAASLKNDKKLLVVSQEIKFARVLAGNNPKGRDRALKNLKKWFENRAKTIPFTEDDFMRIWKGLFYSMWMSDKPLIQEECAENISSLLHSLPTTEGSLLFFKSGLMILINEWFGIDQLRLDKFLMLIRRLLRQAIVVLKNANFQRSSIKLFTRYLSETILKTTSHVNDDVNINNRKIPLGLLMHFTDIYLEELAKIGGGGDNELNINLLPEFLTPFIQYLALCDDDRLLRHINDNIFIYLIKQSDLGLEYQAKYNVWRQQQFHGTIDDIKRIEINNDDHDDDDDDDADAEDDEKVYDPRAGRVNVELPQLKFHPKAVAAKLLQHKFDKGSTLKSRKTITKLAELFKQMATTGKYPIGIKQLNLIKKKKNDDDTNINNAVKRLIEFDDEIMDRKQPPPSQQQNGNGGGLLEEKKNKKRKNDNVDKKNTLVVVAGGASAAVEKRTKRKNLPSSSTTTTTTAASIKRQKIATNQMIEFNNFDNVESIFARNSGIWVVTTTTTNESPQTIDNNNKELIVITDTTTATTVENNNNNNKENKTLLKKKRAAAAAAIDKKVNNRNLNKLENKKKLKKILSRNLLENLDQKLVNNLTTPTKKVKINMRLNTSQDVSEHHAQIKSSPAIPYDASKKPLKPLLKTATATTPFSSSPINPFYNCL